MTSTEEKLDLMERRVSYALREWIHDTPMSRCRVSSDECPDWPLANELCAMVLQAAGVRDVLNENQRLRESFASIEAMAMDAVLQLVYHRGPVTFEGRGTHGFWYYAACRMADFEAEGEFSDVAKALIRAGHEARETTR